jgi:hypothetical protein
MQVKLGAKTKKLPGKEIQFQKCSQHQFKVEVILTLTKTKLMPQASITNKNLQLNLHRNYQKIRKMISF